MKLSNSAQYAIQATLQLSESKTGHPVSCRELAELGSMPKRFLLQILRNLVTHGILTSTRGVVGGYSLQRPLGGISLLDLIEATDGPIVFGVLRDSGLSKHADGLLDRTIADTTAAVRRVLAQTTVLSLLPPPSRN
jgi:Rrf2 family protein